MVYILMTALFLISATFFLIKNNLNLGIYYSSMNQNLPPVVKSWPLVGPLYMLLKDPVNLIKKSYEKHGSVFTMKMFGQSATFLIGPEVSKHFYTAPESELGKEMYKLLIVALFGPNLNTEAAIQLVLKGTRPKMLKCYVPQILTEAQDYFSKWQDCGTVDLVHEFERLITLAIARCLLGRDVREILNERIPALLRDLSGGILPISVLFPYLPIPAHNRRDKARDNLLHIFSNIMNSRKNSPQPEEDFLQTLLEDGDDHINSEQISAFILGVLFVGKHTTASTAVWTGAYLLQHKTYFSKVFEEQKELFGRHGLKIDFDILREMDVLYRCIKEATRMAPTTIVKPRYCHKNFTVTTKEGKEYTIPKGHIVATSPAMGHRLNHIFKNPDKYDPDRYLSAEGKEMASQPFSYITFGAGTHACPGETFAYIMLKIIWSYLIRNFELNLASPFPDCEWNGTDKILVHYKRRQLSI